MGKWLTVLLVCLLQVSCMNQDGVKLVPKKDLVPLLVDLNIADAIASNYQFNNQFGDIDSAVFYGSIFKKHKHTKQELDKTLIYYSNKPQEVSAIYEEVFAELSKRSEEAKAAESALSSRFNKSIWQNNKVLIVNGDTVSYPADTDIRIDSIGHYLISTNIIFKKDDQSINPRITAYFYDSSKNDIKSRIYFKEFPMAKTDFPREYKISMELKDPRYTRLHIIIPNFDSVSTNFHKNIRITYLTVSRIILSEQK
jgi:hypothetical protein